MLKHFPTDVADREDLTFFMSVGKFREFISSIRSANNFYFDPVSILNRGGMLEIGMPIPT
jgi:hypothetical protein